jgi:hypothetical protein
VVEIDLRIKMNHQDATWGKPEMGDRGVKSYNLSNPDR